MYGSNFIKQHSETVPVRSYRNADCSLRKNFFVAFSAHFRSTTNNSINLPNWNKVVKLPRLEQFLHCGLNFAIASRRFIGDIHNSSVVGLFMTPTGQWKRLDRVMVEFITHRPTVTVQLHNFDLFRTCRTSSFCTVAWQLARYQLTLRIARSLGDSWASCHSLFVISRCCWSTYAMSPAPPVRYVISQCYSPMRKT